MFGDKTELRVHVSVHPKGVGSGGGEEHCTHKSSMHHIEQWSVVWRYISDSKRKEKKAKTKLDEHIFPW